MMVAAGRGALSIADNPAMWISATAEKPMTSHFTRCARPPAIDTDVRRPILRCEEGAPRRASPHCVVDRMAFDYRAGFLTGRETFGLQ
jgi:hypothetical protein